MRLLFLVLSAAVALGAGPANALTAFGTDDFNDNSLSPADWKVLSANQGQLTNANGRLEFTASGPALVNLGWRPFPADALSGPWEVQVDVNLQPGTVATELDLVVGASGRSFSMTVVGSANGRLNIYAEETSTLQRVLHGSATTQSTALAVHIRYDPVSGELFGDYDDDGSVGGYTWTNLANIPWTTQADRALLVALSNGAVTGGAYFDNFAAVAVPEPSTYALMAAGLIMLWLARRRSRR